MTIVKSSNSNILMKNMELPSDRMSVAVIKEIDVKEIDVEQTNGEENGSKLLKTNKKQLITTYFDEIMFIFVSI